MAAATPILPGAWSGCYVGKECTLHQLSPYIGKLKSAMAAELVQTFSSPGDTIYDPFGGSGTVALEAWIAGRNCVANDLNPYANTLLKGKLANPLNLEEALRRLKKYKRRLDRLDTEHLSVPDWVSAFFHDRTLSEAILWATVLKEHHEWFLLACLMGILHHQRPGFLSFPASHAVPYLRTAKFPKTEFPELYEYRPVYDRLQNKVKRALRRVPKLDPKIRRSVRSGNAGRLYLCSEVQAIITSPPYMSRLSYARDNRLRLWFLGHECHDELEPQISPRFDSFIRLMDRSLATWENFLSIDGHCVLVLGNEVLPRKLGLLPDAVRKLVLERHTYLSLVDVREDPIPIERRVRRNARGSKSEVILVFQKTSSRRKA